MFRLNLFIILAILAFIATGDAQRWAPFQAAAPIASDAGWGGGPNLRQRNVYGPNPITTDPYTYYTGGCNGPCSYADLIQTNGMTGLRPYDLHASACTSSTGNASAAQGRYMWITFPDHESITHQWNDASDMMIGYSDDPGVLPKLVIPRLRYLAQVDSPGASFTGAVSGGNLLTVTGTVTGTVALSAPFTWAGGSGTVASVNAGTGVGKTGTYTLSAASGNTGAVAMTTTFPAVQENYFGSFVCDPDDSTWPYKVYVQVGNPSSAIGQFETGIVVSSDLVNWQLWGTVTQPYSGSTSTNRSFSVARTGVNTWRAIGQTANPQLSNTSSFSGVWSGTSGYLLEWAGVMANNCLPASSASSPCPAVAGSAYYIPPGGLPDGITTTVAGQAYMLTNMRLNPNGFNSDFSGNQIALAPVDGNFNILASPSPIVISNVYGPNGGASVFPGPQSSNAPTGYEEDGILHYYSVQGFFVCLAFGGCNSDEVTYIRTGPMTITSPSASGSVIHVNSTANLHDGMIVYNATNPGSLQPGLHFIATSGISGNDITMTNAVTSTVATNDVIYAWSGGLAQELVDRYCYVTNATTAANAAPTGVTATAAAGVVTLAWDQCLSGVNYHLYYGFSPTSQPNLIGTVTGNARTTTYTPYLQTPQTMYFKLVTLNGVTEEGSRVVSAYVSPSVSLVNDHMKRVLALQADPATIDRAWLDSAVNFMTTNSLTGNCRYWGDPSFGVKQDTSSNVSVMFDLCSTLRPVGGDWAFCTGANPCSSASTAVYNPTAFGNTTPGIANPSSNGFMYAGVTSGGRTNNLRRMTDVTVCSSYSKPGTATATLFNFGSVNDFAPPAMYLQHTSGNPGNASFTLYDDTATPATVTRAATSNTGWHMICGTFSTAGSAGITSKGTLTAYFDGVAGTPDTTTLHTNVDPTGQLTLSLATTLLGSVGGGVNIFAGTGSNSTKFSLTGTGATGQPGPLTLPNYIYETGENNFTEGATIIFDKALTSTQILALYNLYNNRVTPPTAIAYNITSAPYSATCNGSANDSAAFTAWNTAAVTWDAANAATPGAIVLNIPNSTCMFLQGGAGIRISQGIVNHPLRIIGAGASSTFSDGGTGGGWFLGGAGEDNSGTAQATTATALKGATSATLTACPGAGCTAALALFTVGQWAHMSGFALQENGYPTNPAFWDYVLVSGKTATDVQFATTPLTHDYKTTWPLYSSAYYGGPATLYPLPASWGITLEVNTLALSMTNAASDGVAMVGKDITLKNVALNTSDGATCEVPSENMVFRIINSTMTNCSYEVDKIIDTLIIQNVTALHAITFQSASVKQAIISEANITNHNNGGGINTIFANSTLADWTPGLSFGCNYGTTYMLGNNITTMSTTGATTSGGANNFGTFTGGVWTISETDIQTLSGGNNSLTPIIPGCNVMFKGTDAWQGPVLQVGDVTQSGANTMITFLQNGAAYSGGFPTQPGTNIEIVAHYAPQMVAIGNYGNAWAIDMNQVPHGAPMDSYSKIIVAGTNGSYSSVPAGGSPTVTGNPSTPYTDHAWGKMVGVNATVTTAYGGATNPFSFNMGSPFFQVLGSSTRGQWNTLVIDAKTASTTPRFMGPTSISGSAGADMLTSPSGGANTWFVYDQSQPGYSTASPSGGFGSTSTTVEIKVDQGVVNSAQQ